MKCSTGRRYNETSEYSDTARTYHSSRQPDSRDPSPLRNSDPDRLVVRSRRNSSTSKSSSSSSYSMSYSSCSPYKTAYALWYLLRELILLRYLGASSAPNGSTLVSPTIQPLLLTLKPTTLAKLIIVLPVSIVEPPPPIAILIPPFTCPLTSEVSALT